MLENITETDIATAAGSVIDLSTKVNITLSILSFALAVISIVFVILTIRQNNKLLYANARPYLVGYFVYEENNYELYFCVKNNGNSSAIIQSMNMSPDLEIRQLSISDTLKDTMIAPNQQIHFLILEKEKIMTNGPFQYEISIDYRDVNRTNKIICEKYSVDLNYILQVFNVEHNRTNMSGAENALRNIEKDLKAVALSRL